MTNARKKNPFLFQITGSVHRHWLNTGLSRTESKSCRGKRKAKSSRPEPLRLLQYTHNMTGIPTIGAITDTFYLHAVASGQIQKTALQTSGRKAIKPVVMLYSLRLNL